MFSQVYHVVRSRADGKYLTAKPQVESDRPPPSYLLLFREDYDALSYLNTHGADVRDRFAVELVSGSQVGAIVQRWSFQGVGVVMDPLIPRVEFMAI
jgi:hypothetical protein